MSDYVGCLECGGALMSTNDTRAYRCVRCGETFIVTVKQPTPTPNQGETDE